MKNIKYLDNIKIKIKEKDIITNYPKTKKNIEYLKMNSDFFNILYKKNSKKGYIFNAYKDLDCKDKDFINIKNTFCDIFINRKSDFFKNENIKLSFINTKENFEVRNMENICYSFDALYGYIRFDQCLIELPLYLYVNPEINFMMNFEFEKLELTKENNQEIYFNLGKLIKEVITRNGKNDELLKSLDRCKENLPDDLKLLVEMEG